MSLHSLNDIRSLQDPLKQLQVKFTISAFPGLMLAKTASAASGWLSGNTAFINAKTFELRCTSFSYPGTKITQSETVICGFRRKIGIHQNKSGTWNCVVTEDQEGGVLNTIQNWCDIIHNPMTGIRLPSSLYVSTAVVEIEGKKDHNRSLWLKGFYPISYTVNDIDTNSSNPVNVNIVFNYDWWTETPTSISALGI